MGGGGGGGELPHSVATSTAPLDLKLPVNIEVYFPGLALPPPKNSRVYGILLTGQAASNRGWVVIRVCRQDSCM